MSINRIPSISLGGMIRRTEFASDGSITLHNRTKYVLLTGCGGGASGGRHNDGSTITAFGGGSASALVETRFDVVGGSTYGVTIGSGGAAVTASDTNGNPGGATTFGDVTIPGSSASQHYTEGQWDTVPNGSSGFFDGAQGGVSAGGTGKSARGYAGGAGGASEVSGGAASALAPGGAGNDTGNGSDGSRGSGGGATNTGTQSGAGGDGFLIVEEYA